MKTLVAKIYTEVVFNVAFQTPYNIGKLFPFKDNIKNNKDLSYVVYNISLSHCGAEYIGKTDRIRAIWFKEHSSTKACKQHELNNPGHTICDV